MRNGQTSAGTPEVPPLLQWISVVGSMASITGVSAIWLSERLDLTGWFDWIIVAFFAAWMIGWGCLIMWTMLTAYRVWIAEYPALLRWAFILIGTPVAALILLWIGSLSTLLIKTIFF
jgi:hypothetical protein